jgi:hypothetical protein
MSSPKLRAERRAGEMLAADEELRRRRNPRLGELGINANQSSRSDLLDANLRRAAEAGLEGDGFKSRTETLRNLLGSICAVEFRPEDVDRYKAQRRNGDGTARRKKVSATSIRRELEILSTAFNYAVQRRVLHYAPFIEKPKVDNVREREIPLEAFPGILAALPARTLGTSASGCS